MKIKILYLFLMLCVLACNKEELPPEHCRDIPDLIEQEIQFEGGDWHPYGYRVTGPSVHFTGAMFHPTDSNWIIYERVYTDSLVHKSISSVYKYNLETQESTYIFTPNHVIKLMDWSVKDWIVFTDLGARMWKIKSNGDSLTQLTFQYENYYPFWSYDGDFLFHYESRKSDGVFLRVRDENMNIIKSYPNEQYFYGDWNKNNKIALSVWGELSVLNYDDDMLSLIDVAGRNNISNGVAWIPNTNSIVWGTDAGIFVTDYITKEKQQLRGYCPRRRYSIPSVSSNGKKIIVARLDIDVREEEYLLYQTRNIYIMDIDGTNERVLNLN